MRVETSLPNERGSDAAAFRVATRAALEHHVFADAARAVLAELKTLVGADAGLVALAAAGARGFEVAIGAGPPAPLRRLNTRAAKLDRSAFADDLAVDTPPRPARDRRSGPRSALWVPICFAGEVAGLLGLSDKRAGFDEADRVLAKAFAELIAVAMLKGRTLNGFDEALREATVALTRSLDRETVLTTLLDRLRRMMPFDRASVMLVEEASQVSVRAVFDGNRIVRLTPEERPKLEASEHPIVQGILTTGTAVLISDLRGHPDWSLPTDRASEVSWLGVPLFARGSVAGLFALSKGEPDFFNSEHLRLAEAMSSQASVAVENAILFEQMQASGLRMQALSRRLVDVQESERRHIARELHDEAGQALASLRYGLRLLEREIDSGESVSERIAELMEGTNAVIDGLHRLAADLRPASLDHLGLEAALRQYLRSSASKLGLEVRYKARGFTGKRLSTVVETALYRVVQEAMTNVVRHARATRVDVLVEHRGDRVMVMIEDDGVGFEPEQVQRGDHFGLLGLQERAEALGGTLTIESAPGDGTTIVVEVASVDPHLDR
jgi:signal transduction histidine kinase